MLPKRLKTRGESLTQLVERLKDVIGQSLMQEPKDLLCRVEFGTVGRQRKRHQAIRPVDLPTAMAGCIVEHDPNARLTPRLSKLIQKDLQAVCLHRRQEQEEGSPRLRFDRRIHPEPFVVVLDDPRWPKTLGAPASSQPHFEPKASFIEGDGDLDLLCAQQVSEVFFS